jgi:hypothetical protein
VAVHDERQGVGRRGGQGWAVATRVDSTNGVGIVVERPIYYAYQGAIPGGDTAVGVTSPRATWYFAEGYTGAGFDEYLTVLNPNTVAATVRVTYLFDGAPSRERTVTAPRQSRLTIPVHDEAQGAGRRGAVAAIVSSDVPGGIVVERPIYFRYTGATMAGIDGGHTAFGAAGPAHAWQFAEGYTGDGFDTYLTILNPGPTASRVRITYYLTNRPPETRTLTVAGLSRTTVNVHERPLGVGRGQAVAARVETTNGVPIVVERPIYFRYGPGGWPGGSVAFGAAG